MDCKKFGRRRSLVRQIGSFLNLQPAHRISFIEDDRELYFDSRSNTPNGNGLQYSPSRNSSSNVCTPCNKAVIYSLLQRVSALETEVATLKSIIEMIDTRKLQKNVCNSENAMAHDLTFMGPLRKTPMPPPPPPPPPPPFSFSTSSLPSWESMDCSPGISCKERSKVRASLGDVIKDLGNVKLRHIERTASGSPVRHPPSPSDLSAKLTAALRKRYAAFNIKTPEKKTEGVDYED